MAKMTIVELARITQEGFKEVFERMNEESVLIRSEMKEEFKKVRSEIRTDISRLDRHLFWVDQMLHNHEDRITKLEE